MNQKNILLYCIGIDNVLQGSSNVAGIQVLMSFWARTFVKHGWNVFSFSNRQSGTIDDIEFIHKRGSWLDSHGFSIIHEPFEAIKYVKRTKANLVFVHGARRDLYAIERACKLLNAKLVFLGASDRDFEQGNELIRGADINKKLYHKALHSINHFITQNQYQSDNLQKYYGKQSLIIPNIWAIDDNTQQKEQKYAAVWVANLRRLKRAEWFINLAKQLPQFKFAIAGGVNEQDYYDAMKKEAAKVDNLFFLGPLPLVGVNELLSTSKLLVCSSEFEGFPNTFLQAWAYNVPVVSTVNPSGCIREFGLGKIVEDEPQLLFAVQELLDSNELYNQCQQNIKNYFTEHHNADRAYQKVMKLIAE